MPASSRGSWRSEGLSAVADTVMFRLWLFCLLCTAAAASTVAREINALTHRVEDRLSLIEDIYWAAKQAADAQRNLSRPRNKTIDTAGVIRLYDLWTPDYNCPFLKERVGRVGDGGKWVCGTRTLFQEHPCVLYSFGSDGDSSFEEQMMRRASCEIHTFDPFMNATAKEALRGKAGIRFHDWGAGHETALTPEGLQLKSLQDTMRELGHHWVDILKIDIEGKEWDVLGKLLQGSGPGVHATQLLVELHYPLAVSESQIWDTLEAVALDNFRLFSVEPNAHSPSTRSYLEFSYIKVSPDGHVCIPRRIMPHQAPTVSIEKTQAMVLSHKAISLLLTYQGKQIE